MFPGLKEENHLGENNKTRMAIGLISSVFAKTRMIAWGMEVIISDS